MKKLLVAVLAVLLCVGLLACAPAQQEAAPAVSESAESSASASEAAEASQPAADGEGKTFKIGFAQKTMDNPFFLALANAIQEEGKTWLDGICPGCEEQPRNRDGEYGNIRLPGYGSDFPEHDRFGRGYPRGSGGNGGGHTGY